MTTRDLRNAMSNKPTPKPAPRSRRAIQEQEALTKEAERLKKHALELEGRFKSAESQLGTIEYRSEAARALLKVPETSEFYREVAKIEIADLAAQEPEVQEQLEEIKRQHDFVVASYRKVRAELETMKG